MNNPWTKLTLAIVALLGCNEMSFAQTSLPVIDIGQRHKTAALTSKPRIIPHQPARLSALQHAVPAIIDQASANSNAPALTGDTDQSFASSAQQNTALGPRISYPSGQKEMNSSSARFFTGGQINVLPAFRPGEALEVVPGLAVVPHNVDFH